MVDFTIGTEQHVTFDDLQNGIKLSNVTSNFKLRSIGLKFVLASFSVISFFYECIQAVIYEMEAPSSCEMFGTFAGCKLITDLYMLHSNVQHPWTIRYGAVLCKCHWYIKLIQYSSIL